MHNTVLLVFKVLGISLLMMVVLTTTSTVIDIINVHNRIDELAISMREVLSNDDCIPNSIAGTFTSQLDKIVSESNVAKSVEWNLDQSLTDKNGNSQPPIDEASVNSGTVNYGSILSLVIKVNMQPNFFIFSSGNSGGTALNSLALNYTDTYSWTVPALGYLK